MDELQIDLVEDLCDQDPIYAVEKILIYMDFLACEQVGTKKALINFQTRYKYAFMAFHPHIQKELGRTLAANEEVGDLYRTYKQLCIKILTNERTKGKNINAYTHIIGHFRGRLSVEERERLQTELHAYEADQLSETKLKQSLKRAADICEETYIQQQELLQVIDTDTIAQIQRALCTEKRESCG